MTNRLVYSPRAYVFTKQSDGTLLNLSPYVVAGNVQRNLDSVSYATITLRNPYRIFTTPSAGVAFHPQDPITIYLERIAGYPVRVFTGYIDRSDYYQLQPGTINIQASCTLKRLQYTYFDPSLPYVIAFFEKYGWVNTGSGSIIAKAAYNGNTSGVNQSQASSSPSALLDGSFAKLLWAVLYDIGQWDDSNIWIEPLPNGENGIVARMQALMSSFDKSQKQASDYFQQFLTSIVGAGGQGSGGGPAGGAGGSGSVGVPSLSGNTVAQQAFNYFVNQGLTPAQACGILGNWQQESTLNPQDSGGGLAQWGGSRYTALQNFAQSLHVSADSAEAQLAFTWAEINGQVPGDDQSAVLAPLKATTTPAEAATVWCNIFEEPGQTGQAAFAYPVLLGNRIQYAQDFYKQYASGQQSSNGAANRSRQRIAAQHGANIQTNERSKNVSIQTDTRYLSASALRPQANAAIKHQTHQTENTTVYDCIVMAANAMATQASRGLPYLYAGGHDNVARKSTEGYDCSGSVSYVLWSAGLIDKVFSTQDEASALFAAGAKQGTGLHPGDVTVYVKLNPDGHTFMEIGGPTGRYWGTTDGTTTSPGAGAWLSQGNTTPSCVSNPSFVPYYFPHSVLIKPATYRGYFPAGGTDIPSTGFAGTTGSGITGSSGATGQVASNGSAEAFVGQLNFPSIEDQVVAILLGTEGKGLMHDQDLLPFVQQVCQASMRSFQSLPNGDFFAFYPDYFGEMGQHEPYWEIRDIEILSGTISINDDALATHVFAVGDNTWPVNDELLNQLFSAGTVSIFNAFQSEVVTTKNDTKASKPTSKHSGLLDVMNTSDAANFIKRYGTRPLVNQYPQVRSPIFEMLLAYQQFMLAWSNQFESNFTFTFMPEVFPGGKVSFPEHGFKMYVSQVTHSWDYESGFTTTAQLTAPSLHGKENADLPPNMVSALVEPIRKSSQTNAAAVQGVNTIDSTDNNPAPPSSSFTPPANHTFNGYAY